METNDPAHLRAGRTSRFGVVKGFCNGEDSEFYVRVSWDGWKSQSSVAVNTTRLRLAPENATVKAVNEITRAYVPYLEQERLIDEAVASFPSEFGLRAFPGQRFIISRSACLWDSGDLFGEPHHTPGPILYTFVLTKNNPLYKDATAPALAFAKGTPDELRKQVTP